MKILTVENLSRAFGGIKANEDISFEVEKGQVLGVIGPNGAGKSTLFDLITGYTKPDNGKIYFENNNIFGLKPDKISSLGIGRTFQKLRHPALGVREQLPLARLTRNPEAPPGAGDVARLFEFGSWDATHNSPSPPTRNSPGDWMRAPFANAHPHQHTIHMREQ